MKHISLFSGIGGFNLACEWLGIETILNCEIDDFCGKVLKKHWPGVPIVKDVNDVEEIKAIADTYYKRQQQPRGSLENIGGRTLDRNQGITADSTNGRCSQYIRERESAGNTDKGSKLLLTAGFPCQPFSNAGRKRGAADDRYLWPETLAVIRAIRPELVVLENVLGISNMVFPGNVPEMAVKAFQAISNFNLWGWHDFPKTRKIQVPFTAIQKRILGTIINDLEEAGYDFERTRTGEPIVLCVPACSVSAPHRRDRVWIVAHSNPAGQQDRDGEHRGATAPQGEGKRSTGGQDSISAYPSQQGLQREQSGESLRLPGLSDRIGGNEIPDWSENWYEVATSFCRVDARIPNRVDRLKSLGNAIVPQVAYQVLQALISEESR
jgi:DNA (cytosine-5)-methyltransferase 1